MPGKNTKTITEDATFGICAQLTIKQYLTFIHLLKSNKAAGLDKIPTRLIRDAESDLTPSIAYLVNKSIREN